LFYQKCGFDVVDEFNVDLSVGEGETASEQWEEWAADDLRVIMMVRRYGAEIAVKKN
jgi:hypothetical protein